MVFSLAKLRRVVFAFRIGPDGTDAGGPGPACVSAGGSIPAW
jgi:hypothetical protein